MRGRGNEHFIKREEQHFQTNFSHDVITDVLAKQSVRIRLGAGRGKINKRGEVKYWTYQQKTTACGELGERELARQPASQPEHMETENIILHQTHFF